MPVKFICKYCRGEYFDIEDGRDHEKECGFLYRKLLAEEAREKKSLKEYTARAKASLLPCPFCGETNIEFEKSPDPDPDIGMSSPRIAAVCRNCRAGFFTCYTLEEALGKWNKRVSR